MSGWDSTSLVGDIWWFNASHPANGNTGRVMSDKPCKDPKPEARPPVYSCSDLYLAPAHLVTQQISPSSFDSAQARFRKYQTKCRVQLWPCSRLAPTCNLTCYTKKSKWKTQLRPQKRKLLHFEWSPPWHRINTYLSQILTFFVLKSGEDEKERIILMKSRGLRPLDFIRIILSSSSLLLVRDPAVTTVIWFKLTLVMLDSKEFQTPGRVETPRRLQTPGRLQTPRRLDTPRRLKLRFERYKTIWLS